MNKILVLGAGFVAGPLVRYFLERPGFEITVADLEVDKARALAGSAPRARAVRLDLKDEAALAAAIGGADIAVSLVPYQFHPLVARVCIGLRKPMVTTSYVGEAMKSLDADARRAGVTILNEVGLDPGIDHMEAMRIIDGIKSQGGTILGFTSHCGGLPAPEARTNPFGYKFSWSPRGVLMAGKNSAHYLQEGQDIFVPAEALFAHTARISIEGLGEFEAYPNRDSLPYVPLYGIASTRTMLRGTLRYPGWCETLKAMVDLGLLDLAEIDLRGRTFAGFMRSLLGLPAGMDLPAELRRRLKLSADSNIPDRLAWLGLFEEAAIPLDSGSALDVVELLMLKKLHYAKNERDMIVLRHEFLFAEADGTPGAIVSTLIDYGIPGGDSSMARTVGLPAAVGTRLVIEGRLGRSGVCLPVHPEIYGPILAELKEHGLTFREERRSLP